MQLDKHAGFVPSSELNISAVNLEIEIMIIIFFPIILMFHMVHVWNAAN